MSAEISALFYQNVGIGIGSWPKADILKKLIFAFFGFCIFQNSPIFLFFEIPSREHEYAMDANCQFKHPLKIQSVITLAI